MDKVYLYIAIASFALAAGFLITSVVLFYRLKISTVMKDLSGKLAQQQIEAIRSESDMLQSARAKVNVFQQMENNSKRLHRTEDKQRLAAQQSGSLVNRNAAAAAAREGSEKPVENGTSILEQGSYMAGKDFLIEKKLLYISTSEVI